MTKTLSVPAAIAASAQARAWFAEAQGAYVQAGCPLTGKVACDIAAAAALVKETRRALLSLLETPLP